MTQVGYLVLGIILIFTPGFLLSFLLFSGDRGLDIWERIATSVGMGAFVDMLIVTILAQPTFSALKLLPFVASVLISCAGCAVLIFLREDSLRTFTDFWGISES